MVAVNKKKKSELLKIMDVLDLEVNRLESRAEKIEDHRDEILEYLEQKRGGLKDDVVKEEENKPSAPSESPEPSEDVNEAAISAAHEAIARKRRGMMKINVPIGPLVDKILEENRMRAFTARVGLMKISICPGPGVPQKMHMIGGPHIPQDTSYAELLDPNPLPLYQSPAETPQWAYNEARHNQIFPYVLKSMALRRSGVAYYGRAMRKKYDAAASRWKKRVQKLDAKYQAKVPMVSRSAVKGSAAGVANSGGSNVNATVPAKTPTRLTRNSSMDIVRTDEEQMERLKELYEEEMRQQQFRKTLAVVPPMIFDRRERRLKMMLLNDNGIVRDVIQDERENRLRNPWSDVEKVIYLEKFLQFPKEFWKIARYLRNKTTNDVVSFYYHTKHTIDYKNFLKQHMGIRARQRAVKEDDEERRFGKLDDKVREQAMDDPTNVPDTGFKRKSAQVQESKVKLHQTELLSSSIWALISSMAKQLGVRVPAYGSNPINKGKGLMDWEKPACLPLAELVKDSVYSEWPEDHWSRYMPAPHDFSQQPMAQERFKEDSKTNTAGWVRVPVGLDPMMDYYQYRLICAARSCAKSHKRKSDQNHRQRIGMINKIWKMEFIDRMNRRQQLLKKRMLESANQSGSKSKSGKRNSTSGSSESVGRKGKDASTGKGSKKDKKGKKKKRGITKGSSEKSGEKRNHSDGDKRRPGPKTKKEKDRLRMEEEKRQKEEAEAAAAQQTNKWSAEEKQLFLKYLRTYGKNWPQIAGHITSKTHAQIRNFYQNYKYKLDLPGILTTREHDLHKSKKKGEKDRQTNESGGSKKSKKRKAVETSEEEDSDENDDSDGSEEEARPKKKKSKSNKSDSDTSKKRVRPSPRLKGIERPPALNPAVSALAGLAPAVVQEGTPRALKEVRRIFHTGTIMTPKSSPDATEGAASSMQKK